MAEYSQCSLSMLTGENAHRSNNTNTLLFEGFGSDACLAVLTVNKPPICPTRPVWPWTDRRNVDVVTIDTDLQSKAR